MYTSVSVVYTCLLYFYVCGVCVRERGKEKEREREHPFNQTAAFTQLQWCNLVGPVQQAALKGQSMS